MTEDSVIAEPDVLIASTVFLIKRGVTPYQFSVASGKGIDTSGATERMNKWFATVGHSPSFVGTGADIVGFSDSEWWVVECKGSGTGKPQTQRNNFDRALASVVSYFEDQPQGVPEEHRNLRVCLGLALPATPAYLNELQRRVRLPLRKKLNLWVLLYEPESKNIRPVAPDETY